MKSVSTNAFLYYTYAIGVVASDAMQTELRQQSLANRALILSAITCPASYYVPFHELEGWFIRDWGLYCFRLHCYYIL